MEENKNYSDFTVEELNNYRLEYESHYDFISYLHTKSNFEKIDLTSAKQRREFFKFMSCYNSNNFSYENRLLQFGIIKSRYHSPIISSMKEWNKIGVTVKNLKYAIPFEIKSKVNSYWDRANNYYLKDTWDKEEIEAREQAVKDGKMGKTTQNIYKPIPFLFSASQTNLSDQAKKKLLEVYNQYNTLEENKIVLKKELELCEKLGFKVEFNEKNLSVEKQIVAATEALGSWLFHRHPETNVDLEYKPTSNKTLDKYNVEFALNLEERLKQRELFTRLTLEGLGVDSENVKKTSIFKNSMDDKHAKKVLNSHFAVVHQKAIEVSKMIINDQITKENIKTLQDFMPDRVYQTNYDSYVISNEKIEETKLDIIHSFTNQQTKDVAKEEKVME